jgi:hypothetical protein
MVKSLALLKAANAATSIATLGSRPNPSSICSTLRVATKQTVWTVHYYELLNIFEL